MALIFSGSGANLSLKTLCSRKVMLDSPNEVCRFYLKTSVTKLFQASSGWKRCSLNDCENTEKSMIYRRQIFCLMSPNILSTNMHNLAGALVMPKHMRLN